jgi:hypothetical protein
VRLTALREDRDLVVGGVEADVRPRDVVDDDRVQPLARELLAPVAQRPGAVLGGEADDGLVVAACGGEAGEDVTRSSRGSATLAATTVTAAPSAAASLASANPIRPEERLPTKRTASIGSRVPPAVTTTRRPTRSGSGAGAAGSVSASIASSSALGSGSRPAPCSPLDASRPLSGSSTVAPRERSSATLACVAGCSHMWLFIAGATSSGHVAASAALVRRLSARPAASLAIVFADAGATTRMSALRTSSRWFSGSCSGGAWPGKAPRAGSRSNSSMRTGAPVSAANDAGPTKRWLAGVWIARTVCPAAVARRTSSSAL